MVTPTPSRSNWALTTGAVATAQGSAPSTTRCRVSFVPAASTHPTPGWNVRPAASSDGVTAAGAPFGESGEPLLPGGAVVVVVEAASPAATRPLGELVPEEF